MIALLTFPPATALLLLALWRCPRAQREVSLAASGILFVLCLRDLLCILHGGILVTQVGGWEFPLGITLAADRFSMGMCVAATLAGVACILASRAGYETQPRHPAWHPLVHLLLWSVLGAFRTGDLFNLYVWFEVMLMSSFVLITLGGGRARLEGAMKYVVLNLVGSALFLSGCGLFYGVAGTLNLADIALTLGRTGAPPPAALGAAGCVLAAFLIKSGAFPFNSWLPASYPTAGPATIALFSALLTKVGAYALIRFTTSVMPVDGSPHQPMLLALACATMLTGVFAAATQMDLRRILAIHILSQVGYILLGAAVGTPAAVAAAMFYLAHLMPVKSSLFLSCGVATACGGSGDVRALGGLRSRPLLYACFLVGAASLAGLPPLSGFFAKLGTVRSALGAGHPWAVTAALATGFLTLYSMVKIHREAFAKNPNAPTIHAAGAGWAVAGASLLCAAALALTLAAGTLWAWCSEVSRELVDRTAYLHSVTGRLP